VLLSRLGSKDEEKQESKERRGQVPLILLARGRRGRISGWRRGWTREARVMAGKLGWFLPDFDCSARTFSTNRRLIFFAGCTEEP